MMGQWKICRQVGAHGEFQVTYQHAEGMLLFPEQSAPQGLSVQAADETEHVAVLATPG
jgi:hypothetical protein